MGRGIFRKRQSADKEIILLIFNSLISYKLNVISQSNLKEKVAASPVASENKLIVRTDKELYAFEE
jgi:hypothetical protein